MTAVMNSALQREIMVAETVKGYPYSALPSLFAVQQDPYSCNQANSCSSPLMTQSFSSPTGQRMDLPPLPALSHGLPSVGMGASGMMHGSGGIIKDSMSAPRKQREFIPDCKKDEGYWDRRRRNNEAAKRSREKRRFNDMILEQKVLELSKENHLLKAKINAYENKFQIKSDSLIDEENIISTMPAAEQILSLTRRANFGILPFSPNSSHQQESSLLSPNSLPSSPPTQSNSMHEDDQYSPHPQYNHVQETSGISGQSLYPRPMSPDTCSKDEHPPRMYSPELVSQNSTGFYDHQQSSSPTALNLSARASRSPIHMEYNDDCRSSDYSSTSNTYLPHKLRHKNRPAQSTSPSELPTSSHLQFARQRSPILSPPIFPNIKTEAGEGSPESISSDDRDSGVSVSPSLQIDSNGFAREDPSEELEYDNENLRLHVERLSNEVHHLRHVLNRSDSRPHNGSHLRR